MFGHSFARAAPPQHAQGTYKSADQPETTLSEYICLPAAPHRQGVAWKTGARLRVVAGARTTAPHPRRRSLSAAIFESVHIR